jgi:hypothetical protein
MESTPKRDAKRIYVVNISADGLMVSGSEALGLTVKGRKECEYLCRQLERRYGKKFYFQETTKKTHT